MKPGLSKLFCQCLGLSSLLLVVNYGDLLGGGADVRMHVPFALGSIVLAHVADILVLGLILFALIAVLRGTRFYGQARLVLAALVPPFLIKQTADLYRWIVQEHVLLVFTLCWIALVVFLYLRVPRIYRLLLKAGDAIGIFFAAFAFLSILQLLWVIHWKPAAQQHTAAWASSPQPPRQHPLLVWIVFDELSQEQVFDRRAPDLALPTFDALRAQSTLYTNVQPVALKTARVIPSLLSGRAVDDYKYRFDNSFIVRYQGEHGYRFLNGSNTVFHDARQQGWRTAAVGWYNPYCGTYGDAIDQCYWMNLDRLDGLMSQQDTFLHNAARPLLQIAKGIIEPTRATEDACNYDVRLRTTTHMDLQQHAIELLRSDQADFIFLHMAVPHSPNIWDRKKNAFATTCGTSYLDNLVLADRMLASYLQILQASPRWKDTTLIVEGDHGWRVQIWNAFPAWTDEDAQVSNEVFDPRPALLVHQAGQQQSATNSTAWPLLNVHNEIENVLHSSPH